MAAEFGHVKISRKAFAKPEQGGDIFWNEPREFSRWEAWEWMIQAAAWKEHPRYTGRVTVDLERGEILGSVRFLAVAWGWSTKKVRGFLEMLKTLDRIRAQRETQSGTVYLLVNYETYNGEQSEKGTPKGTQRAQQGHTEGTLRAQREAVKQLSSKEESSIYQAAPTLKIHHDGPTTDEEVSRIIIAANRGIADNPNIDDPRPISTSHGGSRQAVHDWLMVNRIPADVVARCVYDRAKAYKPRPGNKQPFSLVYFNGAVLQAGGIHEAKTADIPGEVTLAAPVDRSEVGIWKAENPEAFAELESRIRTELEAEEQYSRASEGVKKTYLHDAVKAAVKRRIRDSTARAVGQ